MMVGGKRLSESIPPKITYPAGTIPGQLIKQQAVQAKKTMEVPQYKFTKQGTSSQKLDQKDNEEKVDDAPKDWLEPKIFKGTSIS